MANIPVRPATPAKKMTALVAVRFFNSGAESNAAAQKYIGRGLLAGLFFNALVLAGGCAVHAAAPVAHVSLPVGTGPKLELAQLRKLIAGATAIPPTNLIEEVVGQRLEDGIVSKGPSGEKNIKYNIDRDTYNIDYSVQIDDKGADYFLDISINGAVDGCINFADIQNISEQSGWADFMYFADPGKNGIGLVKEKLRLQATGPDIWSGARDALPEYQYTKAPKASLMRECISDLKIYPQN